MGLPCQEISTPRKRIFQQNHLNLGPSQVGWIREIKKQISWHCHWYFMNNLVPVQYSTRACPQFRRCLTYVYCTMYMYTVHCIVELIPYVVYLCSHDTCFRTAWTWRTVHYCRIESLWTRRELNNRLGQIFRMEKNRFW